MTDKTLKTATSDDWFVIISLSIAGIGLALLGGLILNTIRGVK